MSMKFKSTAMIGATMTIMLTPSAQAHAMKHHHHPHWSNQYINCKATHVPLNNGHDRVIVLICPKQPGGSHNRGNGHDKGNGAVK